GCVACAATAADYSAVWPAREVLNRKKAANAIRFTVGPRFLDPGMVLFELAGGMFLTHDRFHFVGMLHGRMRTVRARRAWPTRKFHDPDRHGCNPPAIVAI